MMESKAGVPRRRVRLVAALVAIGLMGGGIAGVQVASHAQAATLTASSSTSRANIAAEPENAQGAGETDQVASKAQEQSSSTPKLSASSSSSSKKSGSSDSAQASDASDGDTFTMDADCASCHEKAAKKMADEGYTGELHQALSCVSCHDNEEELTAAHSSKYSAKQASRVVALNKTTVDEELCFTCHGDQETLAEATADLTLLTDKNGTCVNPHDLPDIENHSKITCGSCHKMHDDKTSAEAAQNTCINCHHENVYECYTCHA